jgi:DNA-binding NarL/FixJ family response regulator
MNKIRLLLVEDNRLLREGMRVMLAHQKDISVIAASCEHTSEHALIHRKPHVVLLDLGLRNQKSLNMVEIVKREFPSAKIIVMDLAPVQADILQFVKAGASGFILKDASVNEFLHTIRTVAGGGTVTPLLLTDSLFSLIIGYAVKGGKTKLKNAITMTKREREIIGLLGDGMSNREIGQKIRVSPYTIKSHIHNIMEKLALHTRLEIANYSYTGDVLKTITKHIPMVHN